MEKHDGTAEILLHLELCCFPVLFLQDLVYFLGINTLAMTLGVFGIFLRAEQCKFFLQIAEPSSFDLHSVLIKNVYYICRHIYTNCFADAYTV